MSFPELSGKVVVVTGAASGIGLATASAFVKQGARVVMSDIAQVPLATAQSDLEARHIGADVSTNVADVSQASAVEALINYAMARHGRLDILVNNAGITQIGLKPVCEVDEAQYDAIIGVNLKGTWLGMKYAIPAMLRSNGGVVVNMSSSAGLVGQAGLGIYAASKHGVLGLTKAASLEYGPQGVRINAVCPGGIDSPIRQHRRVQYGQEEWEARSRALHPATGRDGTVEEIAAVILFLCSDGASNIHAAAIAVDGGRVAQ